MHISDCDQIFGCYGAQTDTRETFRPTVTSLFPHSVLHSYRAEFKLYFFIVSMATSRQADIYMDDCVLPMDCVMMKNIYLAVGVERHYTL